MFDVACMRTHLTDCLSWACIFCVARYALLPDLEYMVRILVRIKNEFRQERGRIVRVRALIIHYRVEVPCLGSSPVLGMQRFLPLLLFVRERQQAITCGRLWLMCYRRFSSGVYSV